MEKNVSYIKKKKKIKKDPFLFDIYFSSIQRKKKSLNFESNKVKKRKKKERLTVKNKKAKFQEIIKINNNKESGLKIIQFTSSNLIDYFLFFS